MSKPRTLLIGWDAADWKVIDPLLAAGEMPNLSRLISGGVRGNIATIYPALSPMLWTSIATGKRPYQHGIHGFSEPLPDGSGVRPITILNRRTKAIWNILSQNGFRSLVVGWWPSHPAEPIDGVMVSNHFQRAAGTPEEPGPLLPGAVHPASIAASLADLRVHPMELEGEIIRLFVPDYERVDQEKDKRLHSLGKTIAETMSVHAVATELLAAQPWDFAAVYYDAIDHFGHGFMRYHPPRLPWVPEDDFAVYRHVMANAYRYHDAMLGALLSFADERTTVVLMSDHGFQSDHLRPGYIPAEPAGPAVEHRHFGILCMKGPALRRDEQILGASVLDICPTILTLCGLPPGKDMDGKVLANAFREPPRIEPIPSWDEVPGDAGLHPPDRQLDAMASAEAFKQLVELGYVAPPGKDVRETVDETVRELKYNLARAWRDGNRFREAAALAEEIWRQWPREHRFGILLIECLTALGEIPQRGEAIEKLQERIERYRIEAQAELAKRAGKKDSEKPESADHAGQMREQYEERMLRELLNPGTLLLEWFMASQTMLEGRHDAARKRLEELLAVPNLTADLSQRVAGALGELGRPEAAELALQRALDADPQNPIVLAHLAGIHFKGKQYEAAIDAAVESLSLLYFQPALHALLGRALLECGRFEEAETELQVAVAQHPRHLVAHEHLGRLYRNHLNRPFDAFVHEGKANALRYERKTAREESGPKPVESSGGGLTDIAVQENEREVPPPFEAGVDAGSVITVVSGLPRSGTSLMMQLLAGGGIEPLADAHRAADEDNPLGYYEFQKAQELSKDRSWLPQARGKAVKIVAQLLPALPQGEHYQIIWMQRDLREVVASQKAMLARLGRTGAAIDDEALMNTYAAQLQQVKKQLASRYDVRVLTVNYAGLLGDAGTAVERIARFLGGSFQRVAAVQAIRPDLRRQRID